MDIIQVNDNRIVRALRFIKNKFSFDAHESAQISPYGDDSCPVPGLKGVKSKTSTDSIHVILGYFNRNPKAQTGEKRLFATDSEGNFVCSIWLKYDGSIEFNNDSGEIEPANYGVKYNELATQFNQLKSDFGTLLTKYNTHVHLNTGIVTTNTTTANSADITQCKNSKIKTT